MVRQSDLPAIIECGKFRIFPHRRQLFADGRPITLGGRAFDVLMALIEASGGVFSKHQLLSWVRPDRVVEENRLQEEISALRKVFGPDHELIQTVSERGHQIIGEICEVGAGVSARQIPPRLVVPAPPHPATNLFESEPALIRLRSHALRERDHVTAQVAQQPPSEFAD
jgi:DNA-binding winged helix-turn-helix (wHTH) protein